MSEIVNAQIDGIEANPFRLLNKYPYVERKLDALARSIADVGLWEGIIARRAQRGYEIAFGHHRLEAARRSGMKRVPLIVRDLSDEQMLQFMGRENMEDYNADFLVMLETWEAAIKFLGSDKIQKSQPIDVASLLGWIVARHDRDRGQMSMTAKACNSAHTLIAGGYIARDQLHDITVTAATEILGRAQARMDQIDRAGSQTRRPAKEIEQAKRHVAKAATRTVEDARSGRVASRDLRARVDLHAFREAKDAKPTPLFAVFGNAVADNIGRMLESDTAAEKLAEIAKVIGKVTLEDDQKCLRRIDFELTELGKRTEHWRKRLIPVGTKLVPIETPRLGVRK